MPTFLSELASQLRGIWSRLDGGQRMTIISVALAAVVGLIGIVWLAGQPDYVKIHSASDSAEFAEANRVLTTAGIPIKTEGTDILVERGDANHAQNVLLSSGVAANADPDRMNGDSGLASGRLETQDRLRAKYNRRAEKQVAMLDGVVRAYVTSSKPKRSVYSALDEENRPGASVTIQLRPGVAFAPVARNAIAAVSTAVGVPQKYVTAINAKTKELFTLDEHGRDASGGDFIQQQRQRSRALTEVAQAMLNRIYEGKALVTVTLDLDPRYVSSEEKIQPSTEAVVSEDTTEDIRPVGTGGSTGNSSSATLADGSSSAPPLAESKSKTSKRILEPFSGTRRTGMLSPDIRRMSVALVLDESIEGKQNAIQEAVKSAVGFSETARDSGQADEISVLVEKFPEIPEMAEVASGGMMEMAREFGPMLAQILGVGLVLLFLKNLLKAPKPGAIEQPKVSASPASSSDSSAEIPEVSLNPDERRRRLRREIERSIAEDPAAMSRMLESWLAEQQRA